MQRDVSFTLAENRETYWSVSRSLKHPPASPAPTRSIHDQVDRVISLALIDVVVVGRTNCSLRSE
jgi:hypothetical protein